MTLALSGSSERNLSARLEEPVAPIEIAPTEMFEGTCEMPEAGPTDMAAFRAGPAAGRESLGGDISPARYVMDPYPTFNGIAVDSENGKVLMSDTNRKGLLLYDRASGSRAGEETQPERQVMGPNTLLGYVAGVAVDPVRREVYGVNNDVEDNLAVFSYDDDGDLKPKRALAVPHGAYDVSLSQSRGEIAVAVQNTHSVVVYQREAKGVEAPLRIIRGESTGLEDPHGVEWDPVNKELVVLNLGNKSSAAARGGYIPPPSITVYPETAEGDVKSLRTIEGPRTQLASPMGLDVDPEHNEIAVANNGDNSVLIFQRTATGNVAPARIVRGPRTGIDRPMGVAIDRRNNELWVANFGNHSAVVFARTANGNIVPQRVIRNAPAGTPTGGFGNPMAASYDTTRGEILVPN
jgi:DNA-binding beta-propeller fold protein YncE